MKKYERIIYFLSIIGIEMVFFIVILFSTNTAVAQSVFGVFAGFWALAVLYFLIASRRINIVINKKEDPINWVGQDLIKKYYGKTNKVNKQDLIRIKKLEYWKIIFYALLGTFISISLSLLAFYI